MAQNTTSGLIVSLAMISLFSIAIILFAVGFANDNNAAVNINDDSNISNLNTVTKSGVEQFQVETEESFSAIMNTSIEKGSDVIKSPSVFSITWKNLFGTLSTTVNLGWKKVFGSGGSFMIFFTSFLGIIAVLFTLYLIKAWRGNP